MSKPLKKATIYLDDELHRALRIKAAELEKTISELVAQAIRQIFLEDLEDMEAFKARSKEKSIPFEEAVKRLKARGKL